MLVEHRLIANGPVASCQCGEWQYRDDAVAGSAILGIFQRQHSLHAPRNRPKTIGEAGTAGSDEAHR